MREAALDEAFLSFPSEPRATPRPRRRAKAGRESAREAKGAPTPRPRRYALMAFLGFTALLAIGVPVNALYFQEGRHPAPLLPFLNFSNAHAPTAGADPVAKAAQPAPAKAAKSEAKSDSAKPQAVAEKPHDAISQLLTAGDAVATTGADKSVLFAQKALAKLGYPLRPDGVFGGSTRQAIEKFERAAGIPVKGELTPRLLRQLAAKSKLSQN